MNLTPGERFSKLFYEWEQYGRGWLLAEDPVEPEPPYLPFWMHLDLNGMNYSSFHDDGRQPGLFKQIQEAFFGRKSKQKKVQDQSDAINQVTRSPLISEVAEFPVAFGITTPRNYRSRVVEMESLLVMLSESNLPFSFEIIGNGTTTEVQFTAQVKDSSYLQSQLNAYIPEAFLRPQSGSFNKWWPPHSTPAIVDLGLSEEFMRPLLMPRGLQPDPLTGILGVLENLRPGELGILQVIFQGAVNPWAEAILESVTDNFGRNAFDDAPDMLKLAEMKVSRPLFGVVIRLIGLGHTNSRSETITKELIRGLRSVEGHGSNGFIPLSNEGYPFDVHQENVWFRTSNRLGMLLNSLELTSLVHLPDASIQGEKYRGKDKKTHPVPAGRTPAEYHLGINLHLGMERPVSLTNQERVRHLHVIGATGTGKSTLIRSLVQQDLEAGNGLAVLDPHGDLIDQIIERIPEHRWNDVVLIDPADMEYPIGINLLQAHTDLEKIVLSSDLVSVFRRIATSWGDQMTAVLANAINAFLESSRGGTLLDLKRFLVEEGFRKDFLATVYDEEIVYFWQQEFPLLRGNTVASLITRLNGFLRPKPIRNMMGQQEGIDAADLMNSGKVILAKLSQGIIGEENSHLLGTLLVAKLQQAAQSRQQLSPEERKPFFLYIDEFHHFVTPSMSHILSGARKYGLGLVLAHQGMQQLMHEHHDIGNAVLANAGTRIAFRLGDTDAKRLDSSFAHFEASDLQNLQVGEAIVRIGQADQDCNIITPLLEPLPDDIAEHNREQVLEHSRSNFAGTPLSHSKASQTNIPAIPQPEKEIKEDTPLKEESSVSPPDLKDTKEYLVEQKRRQEHKRTQILVKKLAEARGFKAVLEAPIGDGRVDVLLTHEDISIGVEISVTNTAQYEVKNIQKCLGAKYHKVFILSSNAKHLATIKTQAKGQLTQADFEKTIYLHPDEVAGALNTISAEFSQTEERVKGYKIKVNYATKKGKDAANQVSKILLKSSRRNPPKDQN